MKSTNRTIYGLRSKDRGLIYEGSHFSFKDALLDAIDTHIDLEGVDLCHQDLQGVNLDGIKLSNANFSYSNLNGANISEADLDHCNFSGTSLFDTCFCYSDLTHCRFLEASFGMTDFAEARIIECEFNTLSVFAGNLAHADLMSGNIFKHDDQNLKISKSAKMITGFYNPVLILDEQILFSGQVFDSSDLDISDFLNEIFQKISKGFSSVS